VVARWLSQPHEHSAPLSARRIPCLATRACWRVRLAESSVATRC
jgi:hypothetical protein